MKTWRLIRSAVVVAVLGAPASAGAQQPASPAPQNAPRRPPPPPSPPKLADLPTTPSAVERLGPNLLRVGSIRVDSAKREISVSGTVNNARVLEFVANTKGGFKGYESAIELDTNAINFNLALILIGLDKDHAVLPRFHFDPNPPKGDPVEILVTWEDAGKMRTVRAEELVYNDVTKQTLPEGPWVYTGSAFIPNSRAYMADMDGVLIGFVHTPAPIIENPTPVPPGQYGSTRLNPGLGLMPGTRITVTVRALDIAAAKPK